jgi:hypothetical protein
VAKFIIPQQEHPMPVFVANFGRENYAWSECQRRSTIATMNEVGVQPLWLNNDREGYIEYCQKHYKNALGEVPTRQVASRWFNLMTILSESVGDYWVHRDGDNLWWTQSISSEPIFEELQEPIGDRSDVIICHKPCLAWSKVDKEGRTLIWKGLHPKSRDFLFTESTLQKLSAEYEDYALALIEGRSLESWHNTKKWQDKIKQSSSKASVVYSYSSWDKAIFRIAQTAFATTGCADGRKIDRTAKIKNMGFSSQTDLEEYLKKLAADQDYHCALTDLPLNRADESHEIDEHEMNISLDRIDSNGHYERGNLQLVCKFANRWKGADDNELFRALIEQVRLA